MSSWTLPPLPIWLAAHDAMHKTSRIKRVWDFLVDAVSHSLSPRT